jgi:hypothetical protein
MSTVLIVIVFGVVALFAAGFLWAAMSAHSKRGREHEHIQAAALLSEVPKGAFGVLLMVFAAFKLKNVDEANRRTESYEAETTALLNVLGRPRDPALSAGARGDQLNLAVWTKDLAEQGYSDRAAAIIAYVFHHHLEAPLEEAIQSRRQQRDTK